MHGQEEQEGDSARIGQATGVIAIMAEVSHFQQVSKVYNVEGISDGNGECIMEDYNQVHPMTFI